MASSKTAIIAAIAGNAAISVTKFVAAGVTGSSAMLAEAIHSVVDTGNGILLLFGLRQAAKPADDEHPFGHGKEAYFWSFIVAILIFAVGGGVSAYEGITHLQHPVLSTDPAMNYWVLGFAFIFEGAALTVALRAFLRTKGDKTMWQAIHHGKDPTSFAVLFEDSAALLGIMVAFIGIWLGQKLQNPYLDGVASVIIGLILMAIAALLAYESKGLLVGESADPETVKSIRSIAAADPAVERAGRPLTMHLGPDDVLVNLDIQFRTGTTAAQIEQSVDRIETAIRARHAEVQRIFIEAESLRSGSTGDTNAKQDDHE